MLALDQLQNAENPVHRGADFVADVGEELRLGLGRHGGALLRFRQRQGLAVPGVDVEDEAGALARTPHGVVGDPNVRTGPQRPGGGRHPCLDRLRLTRIEGVHLGGDPVSIFGVYGRPDSARLFVGQGPPGDLVKARCRPEGLVGVVDLEHGGVGRIQSQFQPLGVGAGGPAVAHHVCDIVGVNHRAPDIPGSAAPGPHLQTHNFGHAVRQRQPLFGPVDRLPGHGPLEEPLQPLEHGGGDTAAEGAALERGGVREKRVPGRVCADVNEPRVEQGRPERRAFQHGAGFGLRIAGGVPGGDNFGDVLRQAVKCVSAFSQ